MPDMRGAISYTANGFDLTAQFGYTGTLGSNRLQVFLPGVGSVQSFSDAVNVDFTATKKFGKLELGVVGFAHTDIQAGGDNSVALANGTYTSIRAGAVAVGGLVGYDFGRFTLQADVTREVATRGAPQGLTGTGKETRGLFRPVLPLYVAPAPTAAPVIARY